MEDRDPLSLLKSVRDDLQAVQRRVDYLVALLDSLPSDNLAGRSGGNHRPQDLDLVDQALQQLAASPSQEEILSILLQKAEQWADRALLFRVENGRLYAWKGVGFDPGRMGDITQEEDDSPLTIAVRTGQVAAEREALPQRLPWLEQMGPSPASCACFPLVFGASVPLVLYVDSLTEPDIASIAVLVKLAVLHLQNHYLAHLLQERPVGKDEGSSITNEGAGEEVWVDAGGTEPEEGISETAELTLEDEEAAHSEARRLARLLVAEIKLYNEEEVEAGRREADLYRRLRTDIDRSRRMYEKRVHPLVKGQSDYFSAELVRVLAQDDVTLLGAEYEEPELPNPIRQDSW